MFHKPFYKSFRSFGIKGAIDLDHVVGSFILLIALPEVDHLHLGMPGYEKIGKDLVVDCSELLHFSSPLHIVQVGYVFA
jgi:hypothetical protein